MIKADLPPHSHIILLRILASLGFALFLLGPLADFDTWFHLDMGRWFLSYGSLLDQEIRTFTAPGAPLLNVSWLFQTVLALVYQATGLYGLLAMQAMLLFGILMFLASVAVRQKSDFLPFFFTLLMLSPWLYTHYSLRPHLVEHLSIACLLWLFRLPTHPNKLLGLALLLLVWSNSHGSALVGAGVVGLHLLLDQEPRHRMPNHGYRLALAGGFLLLPFCTPLGFSLFNLLATTSNDVANLPISEWLPVTPFPTFLFLMVMGYLFGLLTRSYPFLVAEMVLVLFYFYNGDQHLRFLHELTLLMVIPTSHFLALCQKRIAAVWQHLTPWLVAAFMVVGGGFYSPPIHQLREFPHGYPLRHDALPQATAQLIENLARHFPHPPRVLNPYNFGGYLEFALEGRALFFVDGRASMVFDQKLVLDNFLAYRLGKEYLKNLANKWQANLLLTSQADDKSALAIPMDDPEWRLVGYDQASLLYVRRQEKLPNSQWPEIGYFPGKLALALPENQLAPAAEATKKLLQQAPDNPWAWAQLGVMQTRLRGQGDEARHAMGMAWQTNHATELRIHMARAMLTAKRPQPEILQWLKELPETLTGSDPPYLENLAAEIYLALDEAKQSLRLLTPKNLPRRGRLEQLSLTWYQRSLAHTRLGQEDEARTALEKARNIAKPDAPWPPSVHDAF